MGEVSLPGRAEGLGMLAGAAQEPQTWGPRKTGPLETPRTEGGGHGALVPNSAAVPAPPELLLLRGSAGWPCGQLCFSDFPGTRPHAVRRALPPPGPQGPGAECFLLP